MTWKDWGLIILGVTTALGAGYYVKHRNDIEDIEGSIFNGSSYSPMDI